MQGCTEELQEWEGLWVLSSVNRKAQLHHNVQAYQVGRTCKIALFM